MMFSPAILINSVKNRIHLMKNHRLIDERTAELSEYLRQDKKNIKAFFNEKTDLVREDWRRANPKTEKEILKFYAETDCFILEDMKWNCLNRFKFNSRFVLSSFLERINAKKVLDYGGGVGEYCVFLSRKGFNVSYCDVYGETWKFAEWRFKKMGLPVKMFTHDEPLEMFDVVVCTDVLEHVSNLPVLLKRLHGAIKLKGFLVVTWAFSDVGDQHLPENEKYESKIYELLATLGFKMFGEDYFKVFQKLR
jgi:2-polyprenyl-3-methyl-5-hydroxy-6-metoxy-1,4-benzoquinol methylase